MNDNAYIRPPADPDKLHYIMSEERHLDLQTLCNTLSSLESLCAVPIEDDGPDFSADDAAPIFRLLGEFGRLILSETVVRVPPRAGEGTAATH